MPKTKTIRLADYTPPPFLIDTVGLTFHLAKNASRVRSVIMFRRNPGGVGDLVLDGEKLKLINVKIDGRTLESGEYSLTSEALTIPALALPDSFEFSAEVEIDPANNTALEGLYISNSMYCTQCEAEGFRKITYYVDRPDVMATFQVRIEGDLPVMLSNGNLTGSGAGWVEWHDPWPKPSYLFALVAGDLVSFDDHFTTASGRKVSLKIWVRPSDQDKCAYAMDSLKRAMAWDEQSYGREYDLDLFQIVAVDDFNMGAMENKGLNIFNSKYVLASPKTATDTDYERIEGIIAHEYFHNWTGDRITCRDWFQLSLKEGLTVYRDQSFSADQRGRAVKRISDVEQLRARQFREDAGPLAHPVRPAKYKEINNFYTATVYEKGAEVISMLHDLVGPDAYRRALDLYFARHDGQACTIEDWLKVFADTTGRDLTQFKLWYSQSGTPRVDVSEDYSDGTYTLTLRQSNPPTPGQTAKKPQLIPIAVGLLGGNGDEVVATTILELSEETQSFRFEHLASKPVPSILRNFSAPVILNRAASADERAFLLAHDTDPFNKWEAGHRLALDGLVAMVLDGTPPEAGFLAAMHLVATDTALAPDFRALVLALPSEDSIAQAVAQRATAPDPIAIHDARTALSKAIAQEIGTDLPALYAAMQVPGPYSPDAISAGKRALRSRVLSLLTQVDQGSTARAQYATADNMTEQLAALASLLRHGIAATDSDTESAAFYHQWQSNPLVIDKWFTLQASLSPPQTAVATVESLARHPDFDWKNPNRFRALLGGLAINQAGFHDPSGRGYVFYTDWLIRLDALNPQTTARMIGAFETWKRYDNKRQNLMYTQLRRLAAVPNLSRDTAEMVERILGV